MIVAPGEESERALDVKCVVSRVQGTGRASQGFRWEALGAGERRRECRFQVPEVS